MIEKIIIAMVVGLFGVLPAFIQWVSNRNKVKSKDHHLRQLSNELEFLDNLAKLQQQGCSENEKNDLSKSIQSEVKRIFQQYKSLQKLEVENAKQSKEVSSFRRYTLLFQANSTKGMVIHTVFYVLVIFTIAVILGNLDMEETEDGDFIYMIIGLVIIMSPIFFALQRLAMHIHTNKTSDS